MTSAVSIGVTVQVAVAVGLVVGSRLDVLPFDASTYAFPILLAIGIVAAVGNRFTKVVFTAEESISWFAALGVHMAATLVGYWMVKALAE